MSSFLIHAFLVIPSFNVLSGFFSCFTQFGGSSHSVNFDKICDTAPLIKGIYRLNVHFQKYNVYSTNWIRRE